MYIYIKYTKINLLLNKRIIVKFMCGFSTNNNVKLCVCLTNNKKINKNANSVIKSPFHLLYPKHVIKFTQ